MSGNKPPSTDRIEPPPPVRLRPRRPCPICGKDSQQRTHPFCSGRCADIDLHRWFGGNYRMPAAEPPDFTDSHPPGPDEREDDSG